MPILAIIPARYASTRFPGKPLAQIQGKSMIQRVYEQVKKSRSVDEVMVATDDERIKSMVKEFGGKVMMTSANHSSGTDRCAEVVENMIGDFEVVINIQGDEPFILPEQIDLIGNCFSKSHIEIATLIKRITRREELFNANTVKVVINEKHEALYFSRSAIPHLRGVSEDYWPGMGIYYKHVGIYGYRAEILKSLVKLPMSALEKAESLEQLRWLANGYHIQTAETDLDTIAVDTIEDLEHARKFLHEN